jgi:hypothetical protein
MSHLEVYYFFLGKLEYTISNSVTYSVTKEISYKNFNIDSTVQQYKAQTSLTKCEVKNTDGEIYEYKREKG